MTCHSSTVTRCLPVLTALVFAACTPPPPPTPQARADQEARSACRQRADQVYAEQNRGAAFLGGTENRFSPFSSSYVSGNTSSGLGERYNFDTMIADCVRNATRQPLDRNAGPAMEPVGTAAPSMSPAGSFGP
ncbi:MAG: hypothetical protein JOZ58_03025 [Acetobacteraceae bacterium]|nr:hypothetical protein [Acetobacteraceae bacterium]